MHSDPYYPSENEILSINGKQVSFDFHEIPPPSVLPGLVEKLNWMIQTQDVTTVHVVVGKDLVLNTPLFLFISKVQEICRSKNIAFTYFIEGERNRRLVEILRDYQEKGSLIETGQQPAGAEGFRPITRLGEIVISVLLNFGEVLRVFSVHVRALFRAASHPGIIRWRELVYVTEQVGSKAMPIVGIMSFLIGLVTAFQAAVQLRQFGANIFVADLAALGLSRELSPLITSVLMAGRTTSAFAAELGIMKINEELDALKVMDIDELQFLIVPRIVGALLASPLLTVWSFFTGIFGAMFVAFTSLDVTPVSFLTEAFGILDMTDLWVGFLKSIFFGLIVGSVGCYMGLKTAYSPESVGKQTTSAVVTALFLIIIADALVTVLAHVFRW